MKTFISYSRRQLYFAEALALSLQQSDIDIWFDLQQLQAGTVWSDGLEDGVKDADRLVLLLSRASLASPYTQAEWQGVLAHDREVILVFFEPVDLPDELRGLPAYDFRTNFDEKLRDLSAYLKGDAEPRHDSVPSPESAIAIPRIPGMIWATIAALFTTVIASLLGLLLSASPAGFLAGLGSRQRISEFVEDHTFLWSVIAVSLLIALRYAVPLLRHQLTYKKLKRGVLIAALLLVPAFFAVEVRDLGAHYALFLLALAFLLFMYLGGLRRSAALLRWMQPEDGLQALRRRVHQPLIDKALFDIDAAGEQEITPTTYRLHADGADAPLASWVDRIFKAEGHREVLGEVTTGEEPARHIAILTNRSSAAWTQDLTRKYGGNLVFIVASTIEFDDRLTETGRYQWVDARDLDRADIVGLARAIGDQEAARREAALEATPAMIDRWKVPGGISAMKRLIEIVAIFLLVFGLSDVIGFAMFKAGAIEESNGNLPLSIFRIVLGAGYFWLASRALVYRKISAPVFYGTLAVSFSLAVWLLLVPDDADAVDLTLFEQFWWVSPAIIVPLAAYFSLRGHAWLAAPAQGNPDDVGIKQSIDREFKRQNLFIIAAWLVVILGIVASFLV